LSASKYGHPTIVALFLKAGLNEDAKDKVSFVKIRSEADMLLFLSITFV
jgi:hypothetical protein